MKTTKYITFIATICLAVGSIYYIEVDSFGIDNFTKQQIEQGFWIDQPSYATNAKSQLPSFNSAKFGGQGSESNFNGIDDGRSITNDVDVPMMSQLSRPQMGAVSGAKSKSSSIPGYTRSGSETMQANTSYFETTSYLMKNGNVNANNSTNDVNFAGTRLREMAVNNMSTPFKTLGNGNQGNEDPFNPGNGNDNNGHHNDVPIGDGTWFLILIALIFITYKTISIKKLKSNNI